MTMKLLQLFQLVGISIRSIPNRAITFSIGVLGISGVIIIAIGLFSIAEGFERTVKKSSPNNLVIVMRAFAVSEMNGWFAKGEVDTLSQASGIVNNGKGLAISPELFVTVQALKKPYMAESNLPLRGVTEKAFEVRQNIKMIEGRMFTLGSKEIIVGVGARDQYVDLDIGSIQKWGVDEWKVVGVFEADGGVPESEAWGDVKVLQSAFDREGIYQTVRVLLDSPSSYEFFDTWVSTNPALTARVTTEYDFYSEQSEFFTRFVSTVGGFIVFLIALGTLFGAINTMYTMVSNRQKELSTLRALGFSDGVVLSGIVIESVIIGLAGGVLGVLIAYLLVDGYKFSTLNFQSFTQVAFSFAVTLEVAIYSILLAASIGFLGGLIPGYMIIRKSVVKGLSAL